MNFCWTTLHVKDLKESLDFYEDIVGLNVDRRLDMGPNNTIVFLGKGTTKLELIYDANAKNIDIGESISIGFEVDSLDEKIKFIESKGIELYSGPFSPAPTTRFFFILDPNGLKVQFVENIK